MTTATLTRKGQVIIPATVRAALGLETGDRVAFVEVAAGRFEVVASTLPVTALKGMFGAALRRVSIEDLIARPPDGRRRTSPLTPRWVNRALDAPEPYPRAWAVC